MDAGEMEVDAYQPPCSQAGTNLRRSNSLPSINTSSGPTSSHEAPNFEPFVVSRIRRHSTSLSANVNNNVNKSPSRASSTPIKIPSRINQIKQEERLAHDVNRRESVHEKEVTSSFQLSHSWDDFTLQCYSPSMQMPVRSSSLTPSPTPSPTRRTFSSKRSMSPVTIRPSILAQTLKRKLGDCDVEMSPPKRYASSDSVPLSCPQPINHSSSNSSLEDTSPAQSIPSGPVVSLTSSPTTTTTSCFNVFKPVRNNTS
ncbi:P2R1A-PPP2R2A-interacting phosphatase regulator 1-like isoform X2 [Ptychodera flava]|uniref:P2R1A-PPP2R2A-interacting phosphatase regulator 1-like isoform X2 n=1 Tax=Ptychodera flava TaxID=63121 RepID=UPI00396A7D79